MSARVCRSCGYNVLSSVVAACPECGQPLPTALASSWPRVVPAIGFFIVAGAMAGKVALESPKVRPSPPTPPASPARRSAAAGRAAPTRPARMNPVTAAQVADLQRGDATHRIAAAKALLDASDAQVVAPLAAAATKDREEAVRRLAVMGLGRIGKSAALAPDERDQAASALRAALKDRVDGVRSEAALAIGQTGDTTAGPVLRPLLQDRSADVRRTAAYALGAIRDAAAVDALVARLDDPEVAYSAGDALGRIGTPRAQQVLMAAYDRRDFARMAGACAFYARRKPPAYEKVLVDLLHDRKDLAVAQDLILSRDPRLAEPARAWAGAQGFVLVASAAAPEGVVWESASAR
ncbi:MAG: hypothetical protein DMF78_07170 [Acidobacteria bacterium]|nr:MAG: hypothetical protein DMF78_07170 [Acidobacteriota bacterium]